MTPPAHNTARAAASPPPGFCESLFHHNTSGIARFDSKLRLLDVNQALVSMTRWSRAKLLKMRITDLIDAADGRRAGKLFNAMRQGRDYEGSLELMVRRRTGPPLCLHAAPTAIYAEDGAFSEGGIILTDITERKRAEDQLRQQADFNRALLNKTSALIVVYDTRGIVRHISPAVEKAFGYPADMVRGKSMWSLGVMDAAEAARSQSRLRSLLDGKDSIASTMRLRARTGEVRVMEIISTVLREPAGGVDCIIATGTDITERVRLQGEVLRVSEAEQARIGHDLHDGVGQSLTGVTVLMESLECQLTGAQRTLASRIRGLLQTSTQDLRRLSHGMSPIAIRNRALPEALLMLAETVRVNFRIPCVCEIGERVGLPDPDAQTHLFRIAQEAVSNSLRHGHATRLKITLKRISDERCELTVRDNGQGIVEKDRNRGGIGLRVMQYRAEMMGGDLRIKTKGGKGVTVICRFSCLRRQKSREPLTTPVKSRKHRAS